jgi:hypothetical protein
MSIKVAVLPLDDTVFGDDIGVEELASHQVALICAMDGVKRTAEDL